MMQPLKSFKLCCLKWSFSWILAPEDLWCFSPGMDYLLRLQRLDLEGWVVSLSYPVCPLSLWMAPNRCHFRIVLWFGLFLRLHQTVHGFTHDKSVPYLFSTPQTRCQRQTEVLIHLLNKLAPVIDIWYFHHGYWKNFSFRVAAHAPTKYQSNSTSGRGARASYRTMLPERSLLEPSFRYLSPGREGEKCRPLDHTWQIPFVHSARLIIGSNS